MMRLFRKKPQYGSRNVGKAIVQIVFSDNSSQLVEVAGTKNTPAKYEARAFIASLNRKDYRVYSNDFNKVTFKDIRSLEIVKIEEYFLEVQIG